MPVVDASRLVASARFRPALVWSATLALLASYGVDRAQGSHIGEPAPAEVMRARAERAA